MLCPCGAAERKLRKLRRRAPDGARPSAPVATPEIEELTGQTRVPVLVDGDEIVHDSKRIAQYLEWKHGYGLPTSQGYTM